MNVGWFIWTRGMKEPTCSKLEATIAEGAMPERKKALALDTLLKVPLDENQWKLSLDELSKMYPLPTVRKENES